MSPILGIWASQISGRLWEPQGAYDALATVTPNGSTGIVTFAGIPNTYKHLQIRWISKSTSTGSYNTLNFNGDTGSNYADHYLYGDGASAIAGAETTQTKINLYGSSVTSTAANVYATHVIDILDYTASKNKTVRALGGQDSNGSGVIFLTSGLWQNTSAINSITITANASNFTTASQFTLYGVR